MAQGLKQVPPKLADTPIVGNVAQSLLNARLKASFGLHHRVLSNRASRRSFEAAPVSLSAEQERIVAALRSDGIVTSSFAELIGDEALWAALSEQMEAFAQESAARPPGARKDYLLKRGGNVEPTLAVDDPWLGYAVSDTILDIVNTYLGLHSQLVDIDQWYTLPVPPDSKRVDSQRWHRDHRDLNIVKVFTYFSEVDREAGALEYVLGSPPGGRYGELWPWKLIGDSRRSEEEMDSQVPESDRMAATGSPGTLVFCNTSGFHRGGFATTARVNSMFNYVSPASTATLRKRRFTVVPDGLERLSPAARFALS